MTERNMVGTDYRIEHLMLPKVEAAASIIKEINPDVNVTYWNHVVTKSDIPKIIEFSRQSDLLGLFADDFSLMLEISAECADICPQIFAAFGPNSNNNSRLSLCFFHLFLEADTKINTGEAAKSVSTAELAVSAGEHVTWDVGGKRRGTSSVQRPTS